MNEHRTFMFYLGLDLGKLRDYTALAMVERVAASGELVVRYLERAALGTPYTRVAAIMAELTRHRELAGRCYLAVDATGVGHPVVEQLRAAGLGCRGMTAVTITSGERARQSSTAGGPGECWTVPRQDLLSGVQVLLERGELKIARRMKEAGTLVRELESMRTRLGGGGSSSEQHDDLALAVALACWQAGRRQHAGFLGRADCCEEWTGNLFTASRNAAVTTDP